VGVWQAALWLQGFFARIWEGGGIASIVYTFLFGERDGGVAPLATGCS